MDPPPCVQNAMMTKDKKPFTYTPGGIDLSEVRSPRMQRRIERNATLGGASDLPKPPQPPPQNVGPLPPAALAAMRPQTQVQVFPSPPPPPPMQKNIPPPPPPPSCPLPTQKITTSDHQVLERPDMTKIIPENPMKLLRKTGGPAPRKSLVDMMFEEQNKSPPSPPQRNIEAQSPRYQPPVIERQAQVSPPIQQQRQPQAYQSPPQQYQPPSPPQNQFQPSYQPPKAPQAQFQQGQQIQNQPGYQPPVIERQPAVPRPEQGQKNVSSNVGSLYIPPLNQQQQKAVSPPSPPERSQTQVQSPGTPTLKEAPRPWQQKNVQQQQELPPWARREIEVEPAQSQAPHSATNVQQRWQPQAGPTPQQHAQQPVRQQPASQQFSQRAPQVHQQSPRTPPTQNQQYPSNSFPVHIEIRTVPYQPEPEPSDRNPNAVYITQPIVLKHPGPGVEPPYRGQPKPPQQYQPPQQQYQQPPPQQYQQPKQQVQQQPKVDSSGARIIPIQIEGRTQPSTPGSERNLHRQQSVGSQPPQSNSFKVIQKITKTDDEDDDTPITQHSPRYPQEMPEQMRRMKINDNGHFRQVPQQNTANRTIPVQMEGNGHLQPYVHPSEQVVPEPKKYMGSNIPSRSFKMLQAMTAPSDNCANANYKEELPPFNPMFNPYSCPYYPPPYWHDYYTHFYPHEQSEQSKNNDKASTKSGRSTPLLSPYPQPYWHDYYPNNYPQQESDSTSKMSDRSSKSSSKSGRSTPLLAATPLPPPYWGYMPPPQPCGKPRCTTPKSESTSRSQTPKASSEYQHLNIEDSYYYPFYPPFFDPFYYNYYYGYPPMGSHFPYYSSAENEEYSGYSSMDEMMNYNGSRRSSVKRRNSLENSSNSVQALKQHFEIRSKSATPRVTVTPTYSRENMNFGHPPDMGREEPEDSDTETEEDKFNKDTNLGSLRSIRSVQNINVYATSEDCAADSETSDSADSSEGETDDEEISVEHNEEEIIPHQLSVIYEESERGESRRSFRCSSAASECTITEYHSEEDEDFLSNQNVKYKINMFQESIETFSLKYKETSSKVFEKGGISPKLVGNNQLANTECKVVVEEVGCSNGVLEISEKTKNKLASPYMDSKEGSHNNLHKYGALSCDEKAKGDMLREAEEIKCDWQVMTSKDANVSNSNENTIIEKDNICDVRNSKTDFVMNEDSNEVELENTNKKDNEIEDSSNDKVGTSENGCDKGKGLPSPTTLQRTTVYDRWKNNEEEDEKIADPSGGTLMRVDSFASQFEAMKRNSGLWNLQGVNFGKPNSTIEEENIDENPEENGSNLNQNEEECTSQRDENITSIHENKKDKDENIGEDGNCSEESEIDFWSQIKNEEDDFVPRRKTFYRNDVEESDDFETNKTDNTENECVEHIVEEADDSTSSSDSSCSESHTEENKVEYDSRSNNSRVEGSLGCEYFRNDQPTCQHTERNDEMSSESESSEDEKEIPKITTEGQDRGCSSNSRSRSLEPQTIKERIEALRNSIAQKQRKPSEKDDVSVCVKNKISSIEVPNDTRSKTASTKSSIKSFEEYSEEEELDSGVISDISRHISDSEEFPELRKLTRYQRAATHSRLFKLLQDECDIEEAEEDDEVFIKSEDKFSKLSVRRTAEENKLSHSRSKLSLPLNNYDEIDTAKKSEANLKLIEELVQSLLKSKKAQAFKNMPIEKLYAAAFTILQEGIDSGETPSEEFSSLLSPLRGDTETSTPAQTPQEFYNESNEYKQYYDSWSDAAVNLMPSKAFKLLQEHLGSNKSGTIEGILAKCPKILSSKNVSKDVLKLLDEESSDCSPTPPNVPKSNDVTKT